MRVIPMFDATGPDCVVGRHAIWSECHRLKIPFAWSGRLTKYGQAEAGFDPVDTIPHELAILRALSAFGMAPPVGDLVYIETLLSNHLGAWHADPCGAWAYKMGDASKLPAGRFSIKGMRSLPIEGSAGAWGDIGKDGNVVNGYLVDVRRSAWDMLRWVGGDLSSLPDVNQDLDELRATVHRKCQFPHGARAQAYQDFWIDGVLERGQRRIVERAQLMGFDPKPGDSVLDVGCQSGGFLQFAKLAGADRVAGVEIESEYVTCARALARSCQQNICVREMDVVADRAAFLKWVRAYFPGGIDHLLCLSMEKHVGESCLFSLIDEIGARRTYVETNAVSEKTPMKLWPEVQRRGGRHVADSVDRNLRRLYQIEGVR